MINIDVLSEIDNTIELLNKIDDYAITLTDELSNYDKRTTDLLHYIENNSLSAPQSCKIVKEIKQVRQSRRKIKNDMEVSKVYKDNINKLINKDSRNMLLTKIHKTAKQLDSEYKNRIYSEEDINNIIKGSENE